MQLVWFAVIPVLVGTGILVGMGLGVFAPGARDWARGLGGVFILQILFAGLLGLLAGLYFADPKLLPVPDNLGGVPIGVPWFGAAGAITVSMSALSDHRHDWDGEWWYWHASRPLVGAMTGTMAVLFFVAGILAVQQNPSTPGGVTSTSKFLYYVIAFVIGYREASFRDLLKQAIDLLLKPAGSAAATTLTGIHPESGHAGDEVSIFGSGLGQVNSVTFDGVEASIKSVDDAKLVVVAPPPKVAAAAPAVPVVVRTTTASFAGKTFTYQ
jgi:hypothetical protein